MSEYRDRTEFAASLETPRVLHLTFPVPPNGNNYRGISWASRRFYLRPAAIVYREEVAKVCIVADIRTPLTCEVDIGITIYRARKAGDTDGFLKVLLDAMQDAVYANDRQVRDFLYVRRRDDKRNPRVEVEVHPLGDNP